MLVFGFVASWIFGREYSDGTIKDLLALPTSRASILNGKFILYIAWCLGLAISNLMIGWFIGLMLGLPSIDQLVLYSQLKKYFVTTALTILLGPPISFFALWGKGFLAPLGFVALTLVLAQIIAAVGIGYYFPWSIPGLYSGMGNEKDQLNLLSFVVLLFSGLVGYVASVSYLRLSDQVK